MPKSLFMANIKVFARLKPCQDINQEFVSREDEAIFIHSREELRTNAISSGWTTNLPPSIRFRFAHVFGTESSQKNVFDVAAKDIVKAFIEGHNGTIFAYGQTGAGKTYTIQGESDNFTSSNNNGLIPRSLSMIFEDIGQIEHETVTIHVSFLEIYKEIAFDLLGPIMAKGGRKSKEVLVTVAGNGSCHLHGLSYHHVESVDEAARLYQLGMANHKTAETPDNKRSSRSHTVFSIKIMRQKHGEEILLRSKLNLVDLAGSERVWKLGVDGRQVSEAKYINFSLHHLETVIIALQKFSIRCLRKKQTGKCLNRSSSAITQGTRGVDVTPKPRLSPKLKSTSAFELGKGRQLSLVPDRDHTHVPYGNSLLTMVLQDSLGGNCNTIMIAALSLEEKNLPETIATCRFAQRVARIVNKPIRNEEIDKNMVIRRLQTTLAKLHLELANYKGKSFMLHLDDKTSPDDEEDCVEVIHAFLAGRINDPVSHGINTPTKFRTSLRYLRQMLGEARVQCSEDKDSGVRTGSEPTSPLTSEGENDLHRVSNFIAHLPCPVGDLSQHRASVATQESGISLNTEHEVTTTDGNESSSPDRSYRTAQRPGPVSSGPCTETGLLKTYEGRKLEKKDACVGIDQPAERKDVLITELELEKEALLNKSKIFTSRLADQRARLVVMSRRGDLPEELENEKIVEFQLQKKKREVESKLSLVIKKLADLKYTERLRQQCKQIKEHHQVPTKTVKELELKEKCTRQKLLARREQMRSLGFSSPTLSHQSAPSNVSFRSGTGHSSLSRSSSMTLRWEEAARESGEQCRTLSGSTTSSVPASSGRDICGQPTTSRSGMGGDLRRIQKMMSCPQSSFPKRGLAGQKILLNRDVKSGTLKNTGKRCPLVEYISNSHRALYHKSTFPRRIENDVYCNMRGTKNIQRTVPKMQRALADNEPKLARSSPNVSLQLNGQASDPGGTDWVTKIPPDKMNPENNSISVNHTKLNDEEGTPTRLVTCDQSSAGETTTSESGEEIRGQNLPSVICLNRQQRERIMKIREFVNAAEVIQRKWRMYKRNKNGEVRF